MEYREIKLGNKYWQNRHPLNHNKSLTTGVKTVLILSIDYSRENQNKDSDLMEELRNSRIILGLET